MRRKMRREPEGEIARTGPGVKLPEPGYFSPSARMMGFAVADLASHGPSTFGEPVGEDESKPILPGRTYEAALGPCIACVVYGGGGEPLGFAHLVPDLKDGAFDPAPLKGIDDLLSADRWVLLVRGTQDRQDQETFITAMGGWLSARKGMSSGRVHVLNQDKHAALMDRGDETNAVVLVSKADGVRVEYGAGGMLTRTVAAERITPKLG
jgi:hypothetical protein